MARAAAHDTGLPPNVEPCVAVGQRSITCARGDDPAEGQPEAIALGEQHDVGRTPNVSAANGRPVRPMPVCTSSKTSRMPWRSHRSRSPASHATRRHDVAALAEDGLHDHRRRRWSAGACERRAARRARPASSRRRRRSATVGVGARDAAEQRLVALAVLALGRREASRRRGCGRGRPAGRRRRPGRPVTWRASLMAPSTASAPELQKNTCGSAKNGHSRAEPLGQLDHCPSVWATTEVWISVAACASMAATTAGWQWPMLVTAMPEPKSR